MTDVSIEKMSVQRKFWHAIVVEILSRAHEDIEKYPMEIVAKRFYTNIDDPD